MTNDTICAPATAPVNSPIAIIRISGSDSLRAIDLIFKDNPTPLMPRHAYYGSIIEKNSIIDDVIMIYFESPSSYTGEDMAEILCHGNPIIVNRIIQLLNRIGIRLAEPGEFTRRAFINGKVDLTEAEAINHIITAKSDWEIDTAVKQMHGSLRGVIDTIKKTIIEFKADIEAGIDFIEEDIEFISQDKALNAAESIRDSLQELLSRCRTGEKLSHGIDIAIAGKPNVGKSSILNLILNQERAIVSHIPGTTRDIIREHIQLKGIFINLIDTAGIDKPGDEIEKIGISLSKDKIRSSSIILTVLDAASGIQNADKKILDKTAQKKRIILINKSDLVSESDCKKLKNQFKEKAIIFSAKTGHGLNELKDTITGIIRNEFADIENSFIADLRIIDLLEKSRDSINNVIDLVLKREPEEIIAFEMQNLLSLLSQITGEITPDDILNSIFNRFCIGK